MANVYNYMSTVDDSEEDVRCKDIINYYLSKENFYGNYFRPHLFW